MPRPSVNCSQRASKRARVQSLFLVVALGLLAGDAARATTFVAIDDARLFEQAEAVVEVTVGQRLPAIEGGRPVTEFLVDVERRIKGTAVGSSLVLRVPGGKAGELTLTIPGAPEFDEGDRAILFVARNDDGSVSPIHLALGAFFRRGLSPYALAVRQLKEATLLDPELEPFTDLLRDYGGFRTWLTDRAAGQNRPADYFVQRKSFAPEIEAYNLMEFEGRNVRWFEFDDGEAVPWRLRPRSSTGTREEFEAALGAWRRGSVRLELAGETSSASGFTRSDGVNAIIYGDPNDSVTGNYVCGEGGTLASGGWWTSGEGDFEGTSYARIVEAEIVVNDGVECLLESNKTAAAELFTHELGHTLGIGHSCGDDRSGVCGRQEIKAEATMRATLHNDGRGASVRADDNAALAALYGAPEPQPGSIVPDALTARASTSVDGLLTWRDNTSSETGFEIRRAVGSKKFKRWRSVAADREELAFDDAKPGKTYSFQVRAVLDGSFTEFSDKATVTMPDGFKRPKKLEATATAPGSGRLRWKDRAKGEAKYKIERRRGDGRWKSWRNAPADSTSLDFDDGTPGETYSFRVQARDGARRSRYSKIVTVTLPE